MNFEYIFWILISRPKLSYFQNKVIINSTTIIHIFSLLIKIDASYNKHKKKEKSLKKKEGSHNIFKMKNIKSQIRILERLQKLDEDVLSILFAMESLKIIEKKEKECVLRVNKMLERLEKLEKRVKERENDETKVIEGILKKETKKWGEDMRKIKEILAGSEKEATMKELVIKEKLSGWETVSKKNKMALMEPKESLKSIKKERAHGFEENSEVSEIKINEREAKHKVRIENKKKDKEIKNFEINEGETSIFNENLDVDISSKAKWEIIEKDNTIKIIVAAVLIFGFIGIGRNFLLKN